MWIGIDDTDSRTGMCTTYLTGDIIKGILNCGLRVVGYPRLVRLNPNIPWKTRGNGAIALRVEKPGPAEMKIGWVGNTVYGHHPSPGDVDDVHLADTLKGIIEEKAELDAEGTNPGLVLTLKKPPYSVYEKTVKEIVTLKETKHVLENLGAQGIPFKNGRGLIGATAAIAWRPSTDRTYELLTYGTGEVLRDTVIKMDQCCPLTFDNYDYTNKHIQITPHSPGPVIYGVRGENPKELKKAMHLLRVAGVKRWILFESNQGTDDHLQHKKIREVKPYQSCIVTGQVSQQPRTLKGGHVIFTLRDETGCIDCAAYEPTKGFRPIIRALHPGDKITVYGGMRHGPLTLNIEKLEVHELVTLEKKMENPLCPQCGRHMKSQGKTRGYRCRRCGEKMGPEGVKMQILQRFIKQGFYEVPVVARRHIAKPLKRMKH